MLGCFNIKQSKTPHATKITEFESSGETHYHNSHHHFGASTAHNKDHVATPTCNGVIDNIQSIVSKPLINGKDLLTKYKEKSKQTRKSNT